MEKRRYLIRVFCGFTYCCVFPERKRVSVTDTFFLLFRHNPACLRPRRMNRFSACCDLAVDFDAVLDCFVPSSLTDYRVALATISCMDTTDSEGMPSR